MIFRDGELMQEIHLLITVPETLLQRTPIPRFMRFGRQKHIQYRIMQMVAVAHLQVRLKPMVLHLRFHRQYRREADIPS